MPKTAEICGTALIANCRLLVSLLRSVRTSYARWNSQTETTDLPRPQLLNPLFRSLPSFKGVGPQVNGALKRLLGIPDGQDPAAIDLLMHMPFTSIDRSRMYSVMDAPLGRIATVKVHVDSHQPPPRGRHGVPHRVSVHDESGELVLVFFGNHGSWVEKSLPVGETRFVSGEIGFFQGQKQITHPDYVLAEDKFAEMPPVEPVYPLTAGVSGKLVYRVMQQMLADLPDVPEWISPERLDQFNWPGFMDAMRAVHSPGGPDDGEVTQPARMRLAYDEYLAGQLVLQLIRAQTVVQRGIARQFTGELTAKLQAALPYELTGGQMDALKQITADLTAPDRMSRLLQGDVGAGKTVVALMAMAAMAESGAQSALMAPTELLASQHATTLTPLCEKIGLKVQLLTGKMNAATRSTALAAIASGDVSIVVGTHALFQAGVEFDDLGLVVVDEQHRFGVHQRLALSDKGQRSDMLVMTATPIPRTLVLTHFGDMAVTQLTDKPKGRQSIDTALLASSEYDRVVARLKKRVDQGAQAYWVCPLVEESDTLDVTSADDRHTALKSTFGDRVGLVHGRLPARDKQAVMDRFIAGELSILVATTVIEVGVDVPNASIMIVEHAERFGLSQLHQLRGRVGRGSEKSACLLLFKEPLGEIAKARLETIRDTDDGFQIAERDMELRGHGDVLGTRQSGMPGYHLAVPDVHRHLLEWAHGDAAEIMSTNPGLTGVRGEALRALLYTFRRDQAISLIRAG